MPALDVPACSKRADLGGSGGGPPPRQQGLWHGLSLLRAPSHAEPPGAPRGGAAAEPGPPRLGAVTMLACVIVVVPKTWASPRLLAESVAESMISTLSLNLFCNLMSSCRPRLLFTRSSRISSRSSTTVAAAMAGVRLPSQGTQRLGARGARDRASQCAGRGTRAPHADPSDSSSPFSVCTWSNPTPGRPFGGGHTTELWR